jgi:hypothetical protein
MVNIVNFVADQFLHEITMRMFLPSVPKEFDVEMSNEDFYSYLNGQGMSLGECDKIRGISLMAKMFS